MPIESIFGLLTGTVESISLIAIHTGTLIAADCVITGSIVMAVVSPLYAFIYICQKSTKVTLISSYPLWCIFRMRSIFHLHSKL